jgi:transmembrane sensor
MKDSAGIEECAAGWIARQDGAGWSAQYQQEFEAWLTASTAHRIAYLRLASAWKRADVLAQPDAAAAAAPPEGVVVPARPEVAAPPAAPAPARRPRFAAWRMAAAVLLTAGIALAALNWQPAPAGVAYATAVGASRAIALADGSTLTLNTDTRVRTSVGRERRVVWLDRGEAYFEIAHDPAHPFVVEAGDSRITVLGTKFSVRRDGAKLAVAVVEGRVQVDTGAGSRPAILTRNVTAVAAQDQLQLAGKTPAEIAQALSWREGKLVFDQVTLAGAAAEFNRYNTRKLVIADAAAEAVTIGGRFEVNNVDGFARLLHQGFGLDVASAGDRVVVSTPPAKR